LTGFIVIMCLHWLLCLLLYFQFQSQDETLKLSSPYDFFLWEIIPMAFAWPLLLLLLFFRRRWCWYLLLGYCCVALVALIAGVIWGYYDLQRNIAQKYGDTFAWESKYLVNTVGSITNALFILPSAILLRMKHARSWFRH